MEELSLVAKVWMDARLEWISKSMQRWRGRGLKSKRERRGASRGKNGLRPVAERAGSAEMSMRDEGDGQRRSGLRGEKKALKSERLRREDSERRRYPMISTTVCGGSSS